jgi:hypothetical protein
VGTGAIFLKLYNGIVVGQQGEGFVAGKENITQSQSPNMKYYQAGFAGTRVKMVKSTLRHGVCCVRQLNILLALNEIIQ